MIRNMNEHLIPLGCRVLDMGTGCGVGAISVALWADRVVAVDIDPTAVRCARMNVLLHKLEERIAVEEGDLFSSLKGQSFDVVLFNPPYFKGVPVTPLWNELFVPRAWLSVSRLP